MNVSPADTTEARLADAYGSLSNLDFCNRNNLEAEAHAARAQLRNCFAGLTPGDHLAMLAELQRRLAPPAGSNDADALRLWHLSVTQAPRPHTGQPPAISPDIAAAFAHAEAGTPPQYVPTDGRFYLLVMNAMWLEFVRRCHPTDAELQRRRDALHKIWGWKKPPRNAVLAAIAECRGDVRALAKAGLRLDAVAAAQWTVQTEIAEGELYQCYGLPLNESRRLMLMQFQHALDQEVRERRALVWKIRNALEELFGNEASDQAIELGVRAIAGNNFTDAELESIINTSARWWIKTRGHRR